jgi:hypothetical protein
MAARRRRRCCRRCHRSMRLDGRERDLYYSLWCVHSTREMKIWFLGSSLVIKRPHNGGHDDGIIRRSSFGFGSLTCI